MTAEEQANVLNELAALRGEDAAESTTSETEEETVAEEAETPEDSQAEEESQDSEAEEPDEDQPAPEKKGKSNVPKLLEQRNKARQEADFWKAKAKELSDAAGGFDETNVEFVHATAKQIAAEMIADSKFYDANPEALEFKESIDAYKSKHSLGTESAYRLFLIEEKPEDFAVLARKKEAKKSAPPAVSNSKLRAEPKPADMSAKDLEKELRSMLAKGELEFN